MKVINKNTGEIKDIEIDYIRVKQLSQPDKFSYPDQSFELLPSNNYLENAFWVGFFEANPDWVQFDSIPDWRNPEKKYRLFVSHTNVAFFTANAKQFVDMIYSEPKNPYYELTTGYEVYLNTIAPEAVDLLKLRGVRIDQLSEDGTILTNIEL